MFIAFKDIHIDVPDKIDLGVYLVESNISESELPNDDELPETLVDPNALHILQSMGFSETHSRKAIIATNNMGAEIAMEWLLGNPEDADEFHGIDPSISEESVNLLTEMGFDSNLVRQALIETQGSTERSIEWLFNHVSTPRAYNPSEMTHPHQPSLDKEYTYSLHAFISHRGSSTHCGHYICHIRQYETDADHEWLIFNDSKVAFTSKPSIGDAYICFLRQDVK